MLHLDHKYVGLLSPRLERFARKSGKLYNFRCPFCGDSKTTKKKTRGYIFQVANHLQFFCHNCGQKMHFKTMLKRLDARLFNDYTVDLLKNTTKEPLPEIEKYDTPEADLAFKKLKTINQLRSNHPARVYLDKRLIPLKNFDVLRWVDKFMEWTNGLRPKFEKKALKHDDGRIIIPFFNRIGRLVGYQGRCLGDDGVRYISISLNSEEPHVFGVDQVNFGKDIYAFEGPLDAMFIDNAVAFAGGSFGPLTKVVPYNRIIAVYDNEPHSTETRKKIFEAVEAGIRVVIWPDGMPGKDINKMIELGHKAEYLEYILSNHIYDGLAAKLRLGQWSKV